MIGSHIARESVLKIEHLENIHRIRKLQMKKAMTLALLLVFTLLANAQMLNPPDFITFLLR